MSSLWSCVAASQIIARGEVPSTERKLKQAGANRVVLPAHIGADRIAHLILHPNARELLGGKTKSSVEFEHHLSELGLDMEEIEIGPDSPWLHRRVGDVEAEAAGRLLAVAILRKEGGVANAMFGRDDQCRMAFLGCNTEEVVTTVLYTVLVFELTTMFCWDYLYRA